MAEMVGTVICVHTTTASGFTQIMNAAGEREVFTLWSTSLPTASERVTHSMWVTLLREALINGRQVTVFHPDDSSNVTAVQLGG
ncbi:hypothetical protein [Nocardia crassostreae]|uniref:hypothetical protein n=1 Tax=Nocardia crassostreae TaxID=53428 RepID=UPI00082DAE15|nr:hypothetical protein [Nocardia crassostreae]